MLKYVIFCNFFQKMSNEFEFVLIRVVHCTPVVPVLVDEQLIVNRDIVEEFPILCVKNEDTHFDLLVTLRNPLFLCVVYSITHEDHEVNREFKVFLKNFQVNQKLQKALQSRI